MSDATFTLKAIQDAVDAGQEITAEQSHTRVVLYRESVILVHRLYTIMLCADCGGGKSAFVTDGNGELTSLQSEHLAHRLRTAVPKCQCRQPQPQQKQEG